MLSSDGTGHPPSLEATLRSMSRVPSVQVTDFDEGSLDVSVAAVPLPSPFSSREIGRKFGHRSSARGSVCEAAPFILEQICTRTSFNLREKFLDLHDHICSIG